MPRRSLLLSALAGLVTAVATAPAVLPPLAFLLAPLLLLAIEPLCGDPRPLGRFFHAATLGGLAGLVYDALVLHWADEVIARYGGLSTPVAVGAAFALHVLQAAPLALGAGVAALVSRDPRRLGWALPAGLTVGFAWVPMLFPWSPAYLLVPFRPFVQVAELGGAPAVTLLAGLTGCLALAGVRARRIGPLLGAALLLAGSWAFGSIRMAQIEAERAAAPKVRVGVVQPNVTIAVGTDPASGGARLSALRAETRALEERGADLVAWPESAYPYPIGRDRAVDLGGPLAIRAEGVRGPVVFGAMTEAGGCDRWNSVIAMGSDGRFERADKVAPMPFAETVPFWRALPPLRARYPCPGIRRGDRPRVLEVAGRRVGVLNCYEDVTPQYAAALVERGAELFLNASNDAWFGPTLFPHLHHGVARLRAVEGRRDLVRVVNRGIGAHVSATGEDLARTPTDREARFVAEVAVLRGVTLYHAVGDWVTPLLALALLAALLWPLRTGGSGRGSRGSRQSA